MSDWETTVDLKWSDSITRKNLNYSNESLMARQITSVLWTDNKNFWFAKKRKFFSHEFKDKKVFLFQHNFCGERKVAKQWGFEYCQTSRGVNSWAMRSNGIFGDKICDSISQSFARALNLSFPSTPLHLFWYSKSRERALERLLRHGFDRFED